MKLRSKTTDRSTALESAEFSNHSLHLHTFPGPLIHLQLEKSKTDTEEE